MTGRMYPEAGRSCPPLIIFLGFNLTFFPQFILGYLGMPRRYHVYPPEFQVLHVLSTAGASVLAVGYLLPMVYLHLVAAVRRSGGRESLGRDGPGMDDAVAAAGPNFDEIPVVTHGAYDYSTVVERGGRSWLTRLTLPWKRSRCASSSIPPNSRRKPPPSECGFFSSPK